MQALRGSLPLALQHLQVAALAMVSLKAVEIMLGLHFTAACSAWKIKPYYQDDPSLVSGTSEQTNTHNWVLLLSDFFFRIPLGQGTEVWAPSGVAANEGIGPDILKLLSLTPPKLGSLSTAGPASVDASSPAPASWHCLPGALSPLPPKAAGCGFFIYFR